MTELRFDGQVALVTGAGRGLGREHALLLASRGCRVVVNDLGNSFDGTGGANGKIADTVAEEIRAAGGEAVANYDSVEHGERIVDHCLAEYGRLDIVINNAGILTPETWADLTLESWQRTMNINLTSVFSVMKAAWPVLTKQKYGRVVVTASPAMYGAGVAAYSASKTALIGLANSLQFEARKLKMDIKVNTVIPQADTRMTRDFGSAVNEKRVKQGKKASREPPKALMQRMAPAQVSAMVAWLSHSSCQSEATIHEAGAGYFAQLNWSRSAPLFATEKEGVDFQRGQAPLPEAIRDGQHTLADFGAGDMPRSGDGTMGAPNALERVMKHVMAKPRL
jgi:3-hydroxyacyl-CoA dehydrogenase/3a,7a,12a-trihydroxy-5b-cholest-24-enoyl-CoA hydratase